MVSVLFAQRSLSSGYLRWNTTWGLFMKATRRLLVGSTWAEEELVECSQSAMEDRLQGVELLPHFISAAEEESLVVDIKMAFRGKKYQFDHWDSAIEGFRETEKSHWSESSRPIIERLRQATSSAVKGKSLIPLDAVHVLDLDRNGIIKPHIDSVKFCGEVIAGVSLLSPSVMLLQHQEDSQKWINVLLPPHSLYILKGAVRYLYTHAIPAGEASVFKGQTVSKGRRISVICRTELTR